MTSKHLELGRFSLIHSAEPLQLDVVSAAEFRGPTSIADLNDASFALELKSRRLWVTRGRGCRIDIEVLQDGKPLDGRDRSTLLESLGCQIRDAKPWNQLILSTSLEVLPETHNDQLPQLSVYITNSVKPPEDSEGLAAWIGDIDVDPPPAVLCATLENIHIQLNFCSIPRKSIVDIRESFLAELEPSDDAMLLDIPAGKIILSKADSPSLEEAVELLKVLPSEVERCFGPVASRSSGGQLLPRLAPRPSDFDRKPDKDGSPFKISSTSAPGDRRSKGKRQISERAASILDARFGSQDSNLHPTKEERAKLLSDTGLNRGQLASQLSWYRRKSKKPRSSLDELDDEMLLDTDSIIPAVKELAPKDDEMMLDYDSEQTVEDLDEHDLIFSQQSDVSSSFFHSQPSTISAMPPTDLESWSTSIILPARPSSQISSPAVLTLTDIAFRTLMGAAVPRSDSRRQEFEFRGLQQLSMSTLAPSMFSPGFKISMAGNSRLLPTISHALSDSMLRNAQTPSLRRKLLQLSSTNQSSPSLSSDLDHPGTGERLSSAVQSRLWQMMQRKLFDKSAGRRLWRQECTGEEDASEDFEDMLEAHNDDEEGSETGAWEGAEDSMIFSDDEDDELLLGDEEYCYDDDDDDDDDWERRAIEDDTVDMLLNEEWNRSPKEEEMFLEDSEIDLLASLGTDSTMIMQDEIENEEMLI